MTHDNIIYDLSKKFALRVIKLYVFLSEERKEYVIEPVDTGTILHQSLDRFSHKLRDRGLSWESFSKA